MEDNTKKHPEGHFIGMWMGIGIAVFSGFGIPLSIATENPGFIGVGPAIGVSIGLAIGSSIEAKYKKEGKIRPLAEEEQKRKRTATTIGVVSLVILSLIGLLFFLLRT